VREYYKPGDDKLIFAKQLGLLPDTSSLDGAQRAKVDAITLSPPDRALSLS
jgi:hypothetical protein